MRAPESPHFAAVDVRGACNVERAELPAALRTPPRFASCFGHRTIRGVPFLFGDERAANAVLLDADPVRIELGDRRSTYVLFVHVAEDARAVPRTSFGGDEADGYRLGGLVSDYELEYEDGSTASTPILRRFAIQQARFSMGSAPFACVPAVEDRAFPAVDEAHALGDAPEISPGVLFARRTQAALALGLDPSAPGLLWIYALPNPRPEAPLRAVTCRPRDERSVLYALTLTSVATHPLRPSVRRKLRLRLPDDVALNALGELDDGVARVDLGIVISARAPFVYPPERWRSGPAVIEPARAEREAIVELAAHPQARLHVGEATYELDAGEPLRPLPAERPVRLRFVERESGERVAVRLHMHGAAGEYLPPRGHHRKVNRIWHQDIHAEFVNAEHQCCYVDGECVADLPLGTVYVEVARGFEVAPLRTTVEVGADTDEIVVELERGLGWRERGWVTADTHAHFLSPQTALLEGRAEGLNVVNVLAAQWGEMYSNVGDFDGRTTFGADDRGRGEHLVRVGSENRMQALGHISLLGYAGELIHPLSTGGPDESALGDPLEATMAEWARRCLDQGGIVVMPHAPVPQLERAADIVLGLVTAVELMHFNPLRPEAVVPLHPSVVRYEMPPLNPYGVADWYRYLNLGYHLPIVGGSDKMSAGGLLGGIRTYAHLDERELTYASWMDAVRAGNTFATIGPLAALSVAGVTPGGRVELPAGGGTVEVSWEVASPSVPIERIELVVGGEVAEEVAVGGAPAHRGRARVPVADSTWIALRVGGSHHGDPDHIAAHTSAVQVLVGGAEIFSPADALAVLRQIEGAIAYVDTVAPRAEARRFRQLRATLTTAHELLHERMRAAGVVPPRPLHDPVEPHEH